MLLTLVAHRSRKDATLLSVVGVQIANNNLKLLFGRSDNNNHRRNNAITLSLDHISDAWDELA